MSSTEPDRPDSIAGEETANTDSGSAAAPSPALLATYGSLLAIFSSGLLWQIAAAGLNLYIPLRMALGGQSPTDIGLVTAAYSLGFLVGSYYSAYPVRRVGHIRAFAIAAALQCTLTLLFIASGDGQHWLLPRFVMGVTGACLAVVVESWINSQAPREKRGSIFGVYSVIARLGLILGQTMAGQPEILGVATPLVIAALFSLCLVPVGFTKAGSPPVPQIARPHFRALWQLAPASVIGCIYTGLVGSNLTSITPLFGVQTGLNGAAVGYLAAVVQVGPLLMQYPLGLLSDRMDRRRLIAACAFLSSAGFLVALPLSSQPWALFALFILLGGSSIPVYTLAVGHAYDRQGQAPGMSLSGSMLFFWALGSIVGPMLVTLLMQFFGPPAFLIFNAGLGLLLGAFVLYRMARGAAPEKAARVRPESAGVPVVGVEPQPGAKPGRPPESMTATKTD